MKLYLIYFRINEMALQAPLIIVCTAINMANAVSIVQA